MYIVDRENYRIQRWNVNATEGVTIAGDPEGNQCQRDVHVRQRHGQPPHSTFSTDPDRMFLSLSNKEPSLR